MAVATRPPKTGRNTALTSDVKRRLIHELVGGASTQSAATAAGITNQSLRNWLKWGEESPTGIYGQFVAELNAARIAVVADTDGRPQAADELNDWFERVVGIRLPDRPVCPGHDAPLDFVWDLFSNKVDEALVLASRGGGKTLALAMLHVANGYWKHGHTTTHFGSVENQAKRGYAYFRNLTAVDGMRGQLDDAGVKKSVWRNGSEIEILPGTEKQAQGPHTHLTAWDELESGERQPYENARGIPVTDLEGNPGQFVTTSTRQKPGGLMQQALDDAPERGARVYTFCVFETIVPTKIPQKCKHTPQDHLNREDREAFYCPQPLAQYVKGIPTEKAGGWRPIADVMALFRRMARDTFETQVLNLRPESGSLIYGNFSEANITQDAEYVPGKGVLWAYDAGYNDPSYIGFVQYREGAFWLFDEVSGSHQVERHWIREGVRKLCGLPDYTGPSYEDWLAIWDGRKPFPSPWPQLWPHATGDPAAGHFRHELKSHGVGYSPEKRVRHTIEDGQATMRAAISAGGKIRLFVHPRCTQFLASVGKYQAKELPDGSYAETPSPEPSNHKFSHPLDSMRYLIYRYRRELGLSTVGGTE